jgi:NAD(P)-dependent dehydrogenase (short-subunit alcohol dehydrogenase family)
MGSRLAEKSAIVTGAANGIGRAIALRIGCEGASVVVNDINLPRAKEVAGEIEALKGKAIAIKADVTKMEEVNRMVEATISQFGKIDVLVNNAGGGTPLSYFHESAEGSWNFLIDVNLTSVFNCTWSVIRHMIPRRSGRIVNIASACGILGCVGQVPYSTAKAGVIGFTKVLAKEVGPYGVNVNCISPGPIETPLLLTFPEHIEKVKRCMYVNRFGKPEEIADMVVFLVSEEASFIMGQNVAVDGGRTLGW